MYSIHQTLIEVRTNLALIILYPPEIGLLSSCPSITHELLEEPACPEDMICFSHVLKEAVGKELPLRNVVLCLAMACLSRLQRGFHSRRHIRAIMMISSGRVRGGLSVFAKG